MLKWNLEIDTTIDNSLPKLNLNKFGTTGVQVEGPFWFIVGVKLVCLGRIAQKAGCSSSYNGGYAVFCFAGGSDE